MKQLEVQILGQSYLLGCPEGGESRLLEAVERVDSAMCKIRDAGKVRARDRIAVLAALNLAFDLGEQLTAASKRPSATNLEATFEDSTRPSSLNDQHFGGKLDNKQDAMLGTLLARMDKALGDDGRLI